MTDRANIAAFIAAALVYTGICLLPDVPLAPPSRLGYWAGLAVMAAFHAVLAVLRARRQARP